MSKYIDAELFVAYMSGVKQKSKLLGYILAADEDEIIRLIKEQPAADVAEVNRCKTCFHYKPREYGYNCTVMDWDASDDDYCSRWEARDE